MLDRATLLHRGVRHGLESLSCPNRRCRCYGYPFAQGQLAKMGVVTAKNKRDATLAEHMYRSDMGLRIWTCTLTQPFLRRRCGHWRKEIRSGRRHASSRSTKTRLCMVGSSRATLPLGHALPGARPPCPRMPLGRTLGLCAYQATPFAVCSALR